MSENTNLPLEVAPITNAIGLSQLWAVGFAIFTLFGLVAIAIRNDFNPSFICDSFPAIAMFTGLGTALSASIFGGTAAANGQLGNMGKNNVFAFTAGGGFAVFLIVVAIFYIIYPNTCSLESTLNIKEQSLKAKYQEEVQLLNAKHQEEMQSLNKKLLNEVTLIFNKIPIALGTVTQSAWEQKNINDGTVSVLVRPTESKKRHLSIVKQGEDRQSICEIDIYSRKNVSNMNEEFPQYRFTKAFSIPQDKEIPVSTKRNILDTQPSLKATDPTCFTLQGKSVLDVIVISLENNEYSFAYESTNGDIGLSADPMAEQPVAAGFKLNIDSLSPIRSAYADPLPSDLKANLTSNDNDVWVSARKDFSKNFETYKVEALHEIFDTPQENHQYLASLISGLTDWIGKVNPLLMPGQKRDLSTSLPEGVSGNEAKIVDFTGNPNEDVKKQARRLIQRYPVDAFMNIYQPMLESASNGKCIIEGHDKNASDGIIYSAIFIVYNRIIQNNYLPLLEKANDTDAKNNANLIKTVAAKCLSQDLAVDAALVDFGLAKIYSEDGEKTHDTEAKESAKNFLKWIDEHKEGKYYYESHIEQMIGLAR